MRAIAFRAGDGFAKAFVYGNPPTVRVINTGGSLFDTIADNLFVVIEAEPLGETALHLTRQHGGFVLDRAGSAEEIVNAALGDKAVMAELVGKAASIWNDDTASLTGTGRMR